MDYKFAVLKVMVVYIFQVGSCGFWALGAKVLMNLGSLGTSGRWALKYRWFSKIVKNS
jgi:hypothetical protein